MDLFEALTARHHRKRRVPLSSGPGSSTGSVPDDARGGILKHL